MGTMNWGIANLLLTNPGDDFRKGLFQVLTWIAAVLGSLLILYAVYLFFAMATADTEDKRRKARHRVVKVFSSVFIIIALILMLQAIDLTLNEVKIENEKNTGTTTTTPVEEEEPPADGVLPILVNGKPAEVAKVYLNAKQNANGTGTYAVNSLSSTALLKSSDSLCIQTKYFSDARNFLIFDSITKTAVEGATASVVVNNWKINTINQDGTLNLIFELQYSFNGTINSIKFPSDCSGVTFKFRVNAHYVDQRTNKTVNVTYDASIQVKFLAKDATASKLLNLPTK